MSKVLVVDDEPAILNALQRVLEGDGYVVVTAGTGAKGLDLAAAAAPDLVILDLRLPDSDGIELVKVMRRWMQAPILILSGFDDERRKRAKLGDDAAHPAYIRTESGAGYRWIAERPSETPEVDTSDQVAVLHDLNNAITVLMFSLDSAVGIARGLPDTEAQAELIDKLRRALTAATRARDLALGLKSVEV